MLVEILINNSHKTLKDFEKESVDNNEIMDILNKIVEDNRTIEVLKKDYPNGIEKLEEALLTYMGENDLKISKNRIS